MTSEEQYLDELLNSMNNSAVKERTMADVLRERNIVTEPVKTDMEVRKEAPMVEVSEPKIQEVEAPVPEMPEVEVPEAEVSVSETPEFEVPEAEVSIPEALVDGIQEEVSEVLSNISADDIDLASMLDSLDLDALDKEAVNSMDSANIPEEPASNIDKSDAISDMLDMLDSDEFLANKDTVEIPSEEIPTDEDLAALLEGLDLEPMNGAETVAEDTVDVPEETPVEEEMEVSTEEPVEEEVEIPVDVPVEEEIEVPAEMSVEEEIEIPVDTPVEEVSEEIPTDEDLAALLEGLDLESMDGAETVAEDTVDVPEETPVEEEMEVPTEEPVEEEVEIPVDVPVEEEIEIPAEMSVEEEIEIPVEPPVEEVSEEIPTDEDLAALLEGLDLEPMDGAETVAEDTVDVPEETPVEEEMEVPTEEPVEEEIEVPTEEPVEEEVEILADVPVAEELEISVDEEIEIPVEGIVSDDNEIPSIEAPSDEVDNAPVDLDFSTEFTEDDLARMFAEATGEAYEPEANKGSLPEETEAIIQEEEPSVVDKLDSIGDSDEDLLALLEGIDEVPSSDDSADEISALLEGEETDKKKKKKKDKKPKDKKKGFKLPLFGKKKNDEEGDSLENFVDDQVESLDDNEQLNKEDGLIDDSSEDTLMDDGVATDDMDALLNSIDGIGEADEEALSELETIPEKGKKSKKGKKDKKSKEPKEPGFLSKLILKLTEEIDDEEDEGKPIEELSNEDIIAEVDAENADIAEKGKKGKKPKKDKKAKKAKKGEAKAEGEDGEEASDDKKKKKKKEKKQKEPKEPKEKIPSKKVLSKKGSIGLVAFCATIIAATVILSSVLPEYSEVKKARKAFYEQDYTTVYENLYNKRINSSDAILLQRATTYLVIERRWNAYKNKLAMGKEAEALDSLIEGVFVYQNIADSADSYIRPEIDVLYASMIDELANKYSLTYEDVEYIHAQNDEDYTYLIYEIVNEGTYHKIENVPEIDIHTQPIDSNRMTEEVNDVTIDNEDTGSNDISTEDSDNSDDRGNILDGLSDVLPEEEDLTV